MHKFPHRKELVSKLIFFCNLNDGRDLPKNALSDLCTVLVAYSPEEADFFWNELTRYFERGYDEATALFLASYLPVRWRMTESTSWLNPIRRFFHFRRGSY